MPREGFDDLLMQLAVKAGARFVEATDAVAPIVEDGRVRGAMTRPAGDRDAQPTTPWRARLTIAADGAASRFAAPAGVARVDARPLGIAARRYYRVPYHPGPWFESWLDLWDGDMLLPGYGWLFPMAGGPDQPRRRAAQHVPQLRGRLGAAAVRRVRPDAPGGVGHRRGHRGGSRPVRARSR